MVFPPLVMLSFKHSQNAILHARTWQCRDEALSLPLVLVIHLLQDGSKGLHKGMILDIGTAFLLINHSPLLRNTTAPFACVGKYVWCLSGKRQIGSIQPGFGIYLPILLPQGLSSAETMSISIVTNTIWPVVVPG
jgi:hypothetical protein